MKPIKIGIAGLGNVGEKLAKSNIRAITNTVTLLELRNMQSNFY